jgi:3-deoxy-D-arabino-heptulosonate 7-phosphate (DAHP) synthase
LGINKCTISNETVAFLLSGHAQKKKVQKVLATIVELYLKKLRKVTGFEFLIARSNMKHSFDKTTLVCDANKIKQFSEKPKYLQKLLLHKKRGTRQLLVDCFFL